MLPTLNLELSGLGDPSGEAPAPAPGGAGPPAAGHRFADLLHPPEPAATAAAAPVATGEGLPAGGKASPLGAAELLALLFDGGPGLDDALGRLPAGASTGTADGADAADAADGTQAGATPLLAAALAVPVLPADAGAVAPGAGTGGGGDRKPSPQTLVVLAGAGGGHASGDSLTGRDAQTRSGADAALSIPTSLSARDLDALIGASFRDASGSSFAGSDASGAGTALAGIQAPQAGRSSMPVAAAPIPSAPIETSVHDAAWANAFSDRVLLIAGHGQHSAEIRLHPVELGPIHVNVSYDDGSADVTFVAQHALTRDAIELALPKLRDLMSQHGLSLGQANVTAHNPGHGGGARDGFEAGAVYATGMDVPLDDVEPAAVTMRAVQRLVDTFV